VSGLAVNVGGVDEVLAVLDRALDDVRSMPVWSASDAALVTCLDRVQVMVSQVAALRLRLVREVDGRGLPVGQGASSTTAWLRDRYRLSGSAAHRMVRLAAALDAGLPGAADALAAGAVNVEQAQVIAAAVADLPTDVPADVRAAGEQYLLGQASTFGPRELGALGQRLHEVIAPADAARRELDNLTRAEERARLRRGLSLTDVPGTSQVRLTGWLDREDAATINAALDPLCAPRTQPVSTPDPNGADPTATGHDTAPPSDSGPTGSGPAGSGRTGSGRAPRDDRAAPQRRLDAIVEICQLACATGELPTNGGDRPHIVVTINLDTLRAQLGAATLDDGSPLSPTTARRMACDAAIIPAILNSAGQILDLGRERRLFTGPLRRALILRDNGCAFPGCDRPPRWCNGHHIQHWADGGPTSLNNAALLCAHHHHVIHHGEWHIRINPTDGRPEFIPPAYIDPHQHPQRNPYHHRE
jgi:hypothetical protein